MTKYQLPSQAKNKLRSYISFLIYLTKELNQNGGYRDMQTIEKTWGLVDIFDINFSFDYSKLENRMSRQQFLFWGYHCFPYHDEISTADPGQV